ncbi:MAG: B12-binding domain-containing radical SAM protein [Candidatus Helarchaeota archaeon]
MLDILLINPRTELTLSTKQYNREPPTGILILYSILRKEGYEVDFLDLSIENETRLKFYLNKNPQFVGITALTNTYPLSLQILKKVKTYNSDIKTIIGGPHVSFQIDEALSNKEIDYVIFGEGEKSLPYLIEGVQKSLSLKKANSVAYRKNNAIIISEPTPAININDLPLPARDALKEKYQVADIVVNRGCPYQCSFCVRQKLFNNVRIRNPKSIINEINQIEKLEYDYFNFYDNINISKQFVNKLCSEMIKNKIDTPWGAELRIDLLNNELANNLLKAGCLAIATGIESGSKKVLKFNNKNQDLEQVRRGIYNAKNANLSIQAYFIIGLPGETLKTFQKTKEYIDSLELEPGIDRINFFIATPYPGSDLYQNQEAYGIKILDKNWENWDCEHIIFETETLSKNDIEKMVIFGKNLENFYVEGR